MHNTINLKRYLLILTILLAALQLMVQTPTVASLVATGTGIKCYAASTEGVALVNSTPLVNGTDYWASQTGNGCESTTRFKVTATLVTVSAPTAGTHTPSQTEIIWNWNTVSGATGYKWNTTNTYSSATDLGIVLTNTETGLGCNTPYSRYIWAYNASGCVSAATMLTQTSSACGATPWTGSLSGFVGNIGSDYDFLVTGTTSRGTIWGCGIYTDDSNLATAAVHYDWVAVGQTKTVRVRILGSSVRLHFMYSV